MTKTTFFSWSVWTLVVVSVLELSITSEAADKVCSTDVCKRTADIMKAAMDTSTHPCQNFYQFACGNFMKKTAIPHGKNIVGPFYEAQENQVANLKAVLTEQSTKAATSAQSKVIRFYKACIDSVSNFNERTMNMDFLKKMLTDFLSGWPLITRDWSSAGFNLSTALAKIASQLDQSFFLSPLILPDMGNSSRYTVTLVPQNPTQSVMPFLDQVIRTPEQLLQDRKTGLPPQQPQSDYQDLPQLAGIIKEVACVIDPQCMRNPNLHEDIMTLHDMLTTDGSYNDPELYAVDKQNLDLKTKYASTDPSVEQMTFTLSRLGTAFPQINWKVYFDTLFENTDIFLDNNFRVLAITPQLGHLLTGFQQLNARQLALFFGWHIVVKYGPLFSPQLRAIIVPGLDQSDFCLASVSGLMGYAVANIYNQKHVPAATISEAKSVVVDLKAGFRKLLEENIWMDPVTKKAALKKMDNIGESVAEPEWINDETKLTQYYSNLYLEDLEDFRGGFKKASISRFTKQADRLKRLVDRENDWPIETPAITNAMYFMPSNFMYYGSGMLQFPFYESGRPRAINFGSFGYIAGHEITHGFDNAGGSRNEFGEIENWWLPSSQQQFVGRAQCFINQYGSMREPTTGIQLNSRLTIGEDIADNGGIRAAFKAFKDSSTEGGRLFGLENYTEDQLFFMSAALTYCTKATPVFMKMLLAQDVHSPNMFRALLPMLNSDDFSRAFNCPLNAPMNPLYKCRIW